MAEDLPERIVLDLADKGRARPETCGADNGVRGRPSGHFDRRSHRLIQRAGLRLVDQGHGALAHRVTGEEVVLGAGDDVDDGVADAEHVEAEGGHG